MDFVVPFSCIKAFRGEADWVPFAVIASLGQDRSGGVAGGICLQPERCVLVWLDQNRGGCYEMFKFLEGCLLLIGPLPLFTLLGELVKWFGGMQEVLDKMSVEVNEPDE